MENKLTITITGTANTGKTTLALEIAEVLKRHGIRTQVVDHDLGEMDDPKHWTTQDLHDMRLQAIAMKGTHVRVETKQGAVETPPKVADDPVCAAWAWADREKRVHLLTKHAGVGLIAARHMANCTWTQIVEEFDDLCVKDIAVELLK